jgi:hypothetical protein
MKYFILKNQLLRVFIYCLLFFAAFPAKGATLYFSPSGGEYNQQDVFISDARINTKGESVNALEIKISFNAGQLEVVDISKGDSVLKLWAQDPVYSNNTGEVSFTGGIPGGFEGDGKLVSIIFRAILPGSAAISFQDGSKILLNDGQGTLAKITGEKSKIFLSQRTGQASNEWQKQIENDTVKPEPFEIKISKDPDLFGGKYFISFFTGDKQTGIDYYEIKEGAGDWERGVSPYLLKDQTLINKILVKAVDKAKNERISEAMPQENRLLIPIILIAAGSVILFLMAYRKFKKKIR